MNDPSVPLASTQKRARIRSGHKADPFFMKTFHEACQRRGCPLCFLRDSQTWKRLDMLLWECVTDPDVRSRIIASRGFCPPHGCVLLRVAEKQGAASGVAMIYEHLLRELLEVVKGSSIPLFPVRNQKPSRRKSATVSPLLPGDHCYACVAERETAERDLHAFLHHLGNEATREETHELYEKSSGLCLPHFEETLSASPSETVTRYLRQIQTNQLQSLCIELAEFIRKQDFNVQGEAWGDESDSWRRAVAVCTGHGRVNPSE